MDTILPFNSDNDDGIRSPFDRSFSVKTVNGDNYLHISYNIGSVQKFIDQTTTNYTLHGKSGYRTIKELTTRTEYSVRNVGALKCSQIFPTTGEWNSVIAAIKKLEDTPEIISVAHTTEQATQGQDKLHIFGSIA